MDLLQKELEKAFILRGLPHSLSKLIVSTRTELCDYQCNGCLSASKILKDNPKNIANSIVKLLSSQILEDYLIVVHDSGYINISLSTKKLYELAFNNLKINKENKSICIDYSSPNIAKSMHVGHLRSTLIGNALCKMYKFAGWNVIGDNHIGDFGTPMGIVISQILNNSQQIEEMSIKEIEILYVDGSILFKENEDFKKQVLENTKKLQNKDKEMENIWHKIVDITTKSLNEDYSKLDITFDEWNGESNFEHLLEPMISKLNNNGFVSQSNGSSIIELSDPKPPLLLTKSNGSFLYGTTDLACLTTRSNFDKILYVVDVRQSLHFSQVFEAGLKVGFLNQNQAHHVSFGTINGKDNKPFKTRNGDSLKLQELIEIALQKSKENISDKIDPAKTDEISNIIGIGSLKFEELKHNRNSNYIFDLDSFIAPEGFTGPYLMYAGVRSKSILNQNTFEYKYDGEYKTSLIERQLLLKISQFKNSFYNTLSLNEPHHLCEYLFELATLYNKFYNEKNVSKEQDQMVKNQLLSINANFIDTLTTGLTLLGINLPEQM
jgi:arginyl-tRNA synthetase